MWKTACLVQANCCASSRRYASGFSATACLSFSLPVLCLRVVVSVRKFLLPVVAHPGRYLVRFARLREGMPRIPVFHRSFPVVVAVRHAFIASIFLEIVILIHYKLTTPMFFVKGGRDFSAKNPPPLPAPGPTITLAAPSRQAPPRRAGRP